MLNLSKTQQRRVSLFFTCLGIAVLLWLFFALSSQYKYDLQTTLTYTSSPQNRAFHPLQPDTVDLHIEGTGWQLLFSRISNLKSVNVSLQKLNDRNYVTFAEQLREINSQFESTQKVISVSPDTLYFDFTKRNTKKVPVRLAYNLVFRSQYGLAGKPRIVPDSVTVIGPDGDLKRINYWLSDSIKRTDVSANVVARKVALKVSSRPNINIYPTSVEVTLPVDEFTEKTIDIPLKLINSKRYDIKLLPERVSVTFLTALSNYRATQRESFEAVLDLSGWEERNYQQLPVRLIKVPPFCKVLTVEPQVVDFIFKN